MTPIGAFIVFMCFVGPILPPIIGTIVGSIYDVAKRRSEPVDVVARRRLAQLRATTTEPGPSWVSEAA